MEVTVEQATAPTAEVRALVEELEAELSAEYPPEQRHGLRLEAIFVPEVRFFVARAGGEPLGCGGVALYDGFAELKRMYARPAGRGKGIAQALLAQLEEVARASGRRRLCLETGTRQQAAIAFYRRAGFTPCGAFGEYAKLPAANVAASLFFEKPL
ncbi:MAG: GNAT family N-acetyltransferase [Myxococcaceae bacterium]